MPSQSSKSITAWVITVVALGMSAFQLYTAQFGLYSAMVQRPIHLLFAAALVLLIFPVARSMSGASYPLYLRLWDWVLISASAASLLHIVATYKDLVSRGGAATETDLWLGGSSSSWCWRPPAG